jgi:flagellar basal-body rod protein FlgB
MKSLYPAQISLAAKVMDMQLQRQNVIMGNIANVNTPRYKPRELEFETELQTALKLDMRGKISRTEEGHMPAVFDPETFGPDWYKRCRPQVVHGEDRVDMDKEMVKMTKNNLQYTALAQITKSGFDGIRNIIMEGSK